VCGTATPVNGICTLGNVVTVLSLGPHNIVDVAGNPLTILAGQLPVNVLAPYVSP